MPWQQLGPIITVVVVFALLLFGILFLAIFTRYFRLWIQSKMTRAGIGILDLLGMTFRKVDPRSHRAGPDHGGSGRYPR